MPFCSACGAKVLEGDAFCSNCGAKLRNTPPSDIEESAPDAVSATEEAAEPQAERQAAPAPQQKHAAPRRPLPDQPRRTQPPHPKKRPPPQRAAARRAGGKGGLTFFGFLLAMGWLVYSSGMLGALAGAYPFNPDQMMQRADWTSFALMIALPIGISVLRPTLDLILWPLQPIRFLFPAKLLVTVGLLSPFAVSWLLYTVWGLRNYEFLHFSLIWGTLISYAILRTPARYSA